jgi:tripartite motif-containing protein 71
MTKQYGFQLFDLKRGFISAIGPLNGQLFHNPLGVCVQPSTNNIVVADTQNHRIQVFSNPDYNDYKVREPEHLYTLGGPESSQPGKFRYPHGVTCNNRGHIVVTDWGNHRVQILDEKGRFLRSMGTTGQEGSANYQFYSPYDVCVDRNNHNQILVADPNNKRISVWSGDGSQFIRVVPLGKYPHSLTIDHCNQLIVNYSNNAEIEVYETTDFNLIQILHIENITNVCATDDGLAVCLSRKINIFKLK